MQTNASMKQPLWSPEGAVAGARIDTVTAANHKPRNHRSHTPMKSRVYTPEVREQTPCKGLGASLGRVGAMLPGKKQDDMARDNTTSQGKAQRDHTGTTPQAHPARCSAF